MSLIMRGPRTKIIATLGDPTPTDNRPYGTYGDNFFDINRAPVKDLDLPKIITSFVRSGVDLIRLNFAHTGIEEVTTRFKAVKEAILKTENDLGSEIGAGRLGVLADLPGPKIRFKDPFYLPSDVLYIHFDEHDSPRSGTWATLEQPKMQRASAQIFLGETAFAQADQKATERILESTRMKLAHRSPLKPVLAFIGDNDCTLEIEDVKDDVLVCKIIADNTKGKPLTQRKGFTIRGIPKPISAFTKEDEEKLKRLLNADYESDLESRVLSHVGISFCQSREDARRVLSFIVETIKSKYPDRDLGWYLVEAPQLIAKIETEEGAIKKDEILDIADGVMIARGDLALEMETVDIPKVSKDIVAHANLRGKAVIMATQMLESMKTSIECTRPEAVDVFNAVVDGVDALMLSGETSSGNYPEHAICKMQELAERAENFVSTSVGIDSQIEGYFRQLNEIRQRVSTWKERWKDIRGEYNVLRGNNIINDDVLVFIQRLADIKESRLKTQDSTDRISHAACTMAADENVAAIVAPTQSGRTARMLSRFRPRTWILTQPHSTLTARKLSIDWGVSVAGVIQITEDMNVRKLMEESQRRLDGLKGKTVIFTCGLPLGKVGTTNLIYRGIVGALSV